MTEARLGRHAALRALAPQPLPGQTEAALAALAVTRQCALIGFRLDGIVTSWNEGAQALYGYSAAAMQGNALAHITPPGREAETRRLLQTLAEGETVSGVETLRRSRDGRLIEVEINATPVVDANGRILAGASLERDICERKEAERALRASEERFRLIVENALDLVFVADQRGRLVYANHAFQRVLGYDPQRLHGYPVLAMIHPADRDALLRWQSPVLSEFRARAHDGAYRWMEGARYALNAASGPYVVGMARDISVRKRLEAQLQHRAWHDPLTGLANRALLLERLQHVIDRSQRERVDYALLLLDLDDFKQVNDRFGHASGDDVLIQFTQRVRRLLRPSDTFARLGGDEFAILLEQAGGQAGVWRVATRICEELRPPFSSQGRRLPCRASVGATLGKLPCYQPKDLLSRADQALYRAKLAGKGCFAVA